MTIQTSTFITKAVVSLSRRLRAGLDSTTALPSHLKLRIFGVAYGSGLKLYGSPIISVEPGSRMIIGCDCRFRSSPQGNSIGVNHPVVLRTMSAHATLHIGDRFGMSGGAICALGSVTIGDRVLLGANVVIADSDFHWLDPIRRADGLKYDDFRPVVVEDDVWIGADAYVCKGVTVGRGSVIGAGSVVTHDVKPYSVVAGNPARLIRMLDNISTGTSVSTNKDKSS